jgi:hypothetical protein
MINKCIRQTCLCQNVRARERKRDAAGAITEEEEEEEEAPNKG